MCLSRSSSRAPAGLALFLAVEAVCAPAAQSKEYHSPAGNQTLIYDPFFFVFP